MGKIFTRNNFSRLSISFKSSSSSKPDDARTSATTVSTVSTASSSNTAPGDIIEPFPPGYKVMPLDIRELNELIKKRYALDIAIWAKRDCRRRDWPFVLEDMARSTAALAKIMATLKAWDRPDMWEKEEDWEKLKKIKRRLDVEGKKRHWPGNPPWEG